MNDAIREAATVDPAWARSEQRKLWLLKAVTAAVMLALGVGTAAVILGIHNSTEITEVQHSACQSEPAGKECQQAKAESSRAASLAVTCIPFDKAGYPCPKPGSEAAEGVRPSNPNTGSSLPGPVESGPTEQPASESPPADAPPAEASHPIRETVTGTLEGVHEAVCQPNVLGIKVCP